jgi:DNA-binding NarL/FixJ family response regulator
MAGFRMSGDQTQPPEDETKVQQFRRLTEEIRSQRRRLQGIMDSVREDVHPLPGSLERLLQVPTRDVRTALNQAATLIAESLRCDKADVFFYDSSNRCLTALGTSDTPMGRRQHQLNLHQLPIGRGGRVVRTFESGQPFMTGQLQDDPNERSDVWERLGVHSLMLAPFELSGRRRAVLAAASARPGAFNDREVQFLQAAAHWVALVVDRADSGQAELAGTSTPAQVREAGRLTARQREIALLIARGLSNGEIASQLVLTPGTVANHVAEILRRLDYGSRSQIAVWAVQNLAPLILESPETAAAE